MLNTQYAHIHCCLMCWWWLSVRNDEYRVTDTCCKWRISCWPSWYWSSTPNGHVHIERRLHAIACEKMVHKVGRILLPRLIGAKIMVQRKDRKKMASWRSFTASSKPPLCFLKGAGEEWTWLRQLLSRNLFHRWFCEYSIIGDQGSLGTVDGCS